ncbi:MAG: DMT family transporter [Candidatus Freyarchaeum deiterrae]
MRRLDTEQKGVIFAVVEIFISGLYPVITKYGVGFLNPLFFAAISALIGSGFMIVVLKFRRELRQLFSRELIKYFIPIGFFGTFATAVFFFLGSTTTSGINSSILLQVEPLYSLVLSYFILKELIKKKQVALTLLILGGAIVILYNGVLSINIGVILVIISPLFWQISHLFAKRIFEKTSLYVVAASRSFYGGILLFALTLIPGISQYGFLTDPGILLIFVLQGLTAFVGAIVVWYAVITRINLSKATAIVGVYPIFSVILAWIFLGESVSIYQIIGLAIVVVGILLLSQVRSEKREEKKPQTKMEERMRKA